MEGLFLLTELTSSWIRGGPGKSLSAREDTIGRMRSGFGHYVVVLAVGASWEAVSWVSLWES